MPAGAATPRRSRKRLGNRRHDVPENHEIADRRTPSRVVQRPRLRDELLNSWRFDSLLEARVIIEDGRCDYNANRPRTAHGELTPTEFALQWTTTHQPRVA